MKRLSLLVAVVVAYFAVRALLFPAGPPLERSFTVSGPPRPLPEIAIADGDGKPGWLADFRGKFVLLNVWATWCVPCRKEMPTLDRLEAKLGGPDFEVVALSIDRGGAEAVRKFYADIGIRNLAVNLDAKGEAPFKLGAVGVPTTLLIDREGREIGRLVGAAEWDAPKMVDFLKATIAQNPSRASPIASKEQVP
jgi:thiol-disulfide isomerase/thioredoxin